MPDPKPTAEELHEEMAQSLLDDLEMCWASADVESVMTYFSKIALAAEAAARAEALDEAMEAVRAPHKHCMHMKCEGKHEAFRAIYELRFSGERGGEGGEK